MQAATEVTTGGEPVRRSALARWLLAIPLLLGAAGQIWWLAMALGVGTDMGFDVGNVAIGAVPAVLYGVAAVLVLADRPGRLIWIVLLFCGAGLTLVCLGYLVEYREAGELMVFPPYLSVLAGVELVRLHRRSSSDACEQR